MRQIILDTETTGLSAENGDRIIEIGCVELLHRKLTGHNKHFYLNPERDSHEDALKVHGISNEFLRDKPKFAQVADELLDYLADAELIIHNAAFDVGFLYKELELLGRGPITQHVRSITDTLLQAKELHPGKRNSLDALCERYGVSNAHRTLHGALLDSELLAEVYLAMTRGQDSLGMDLHVDVPGANGSDGQSALAEIIVLQPSEEELKAHQEMLQALNKESKGACLWLQDGD